MTENIKQQQEFIVTARKWRPLRFSDVVGQEHVTNTLRNALLNNRLHHAFLFCGPRGIGKTTTARIIARAVNCLNLQPDGEPCNECDNCKGVINGRSLDIIEIDGASNTGVDDIRNLRENAKYLPTTGKYKMYIIDEVHMLSTNAFNALLKILEEPPAHLMFVFATTESHKVPATIISRCQRFDFRRMEINAIIEQLSKISNEDGVTIDEKSLLQIAKKSDGSMRDSQSIYDQVVAFCGNNVEFQTMKDVLHLIDDDFFFRLSDCIINNDSKIAFELSSEIITKGYELQETLNGLLEHFRNLLTVIVTGNTKLIQTSDLYRKKYEETAKLTTKANILRYIQIINQTEASLRFSTQPQIKFELALIQMASLDKAIELKQLIEEVRSIKEIPIIDNNINQPVEVSQVQKKNITDNIGSNNVNNKLDNTDSFNNREDIKETKTEVINSISKFNYQSIDNETINSDNSVKKTTQPIDKENITETEKVLIDCFDAVRYN